jgi:hypothetical protein
MKARLVSGLGLVLAGGAAVSLLAAVDRFRPLGAIGAEPALAEPFFEGFGPFTPHRHPERHRPGERPVPGFRLAEADSELRVPGLLGGARVEAVATLASALPKAQQVTVWAGGEALHQEWVGGSYGLVRFSAVVPASGELRLRFASPGGSAAAFRLGGVEVVQSSGGRVPVRRVLCYAALLLLAAGVGCWAGAGSKRIAAGMGLLAAALALGLLAARLLTLGHLTHTLTASAAACLFALACERLLRLPWWAAGGLAVGFGLKVLLATHPAFPSIDITFHAHNVQRLRGGELIRSAVTDSQGQPLAIPYGPALSAILAPLVPSDDTAVIEAWLRWTMVVLEGTAPLLVLGLARRSGASPRAAALAALAMAAMPEGLLVVGKGVAANVLGAWLSSAVVLAVLAGWAGPTLAATAALAFLAHPGSAAALGTLLTLWLGWAVICRERRAVDAGKTLLWIAAGLGLAWAVSYREATMLTVSSLGTLASQADAAPAHFFALRVVHLGKLAQDLLLKFGGGPFVLAFLSVRRRLGPPALRRLLQPWLAAVGVFALLALLTPFALRFEYFALPAMALAAGLAADDLVERGRARLVGIALAVSLLVQLALGLLLLCRHFDLINVIIPSPRWPLLGWPR